MSFKEQLRNEILPKTVDYYNSGMDINSSIVKAAQDFKLNLDQTDRLLETMNTARVIAHYEKNASDRTSDCDIADKDEVRRLLYAGGRREKKASAPAAPSFADYSPYLSDERNYRSAARLAKAASVEPEAPASDGASEFTVGQAMDHVASYALKAADDRRHAEDLASAVEAGVATGLSKLAASLSSGYEPERRYALWRVTIGKSCPDVTASVDAEIPRGTVKAAAAHFRALARANVVDASPVDAEVSEARELQDAIRKLAEARKVVERLRVHEESVRAALSKAADANRLLHKTAARSHGSGGGGNGGGGNGGGGKKDKKDDGGGKPADDPWLGDVAKSTAKALVASIPQPSAGQKAIYDYLTGAAMTPDKLDEAVLGDTSKGTSLKDYVDNMRRSDIISELYADDPIISEAAPEEVTKAYATLVQASPKMSLNKEVVRSVLRQSLNSVAVSPFDAKQWADYDQVVAKTQSLGRPVSGRSA